MINLYHILGLESGANDREIKKAFRKLAMQYHPDRNGSADAADKFAQIYLAYDILTDESKKGYYDKMLLDDDDEQYISDWREEARQYAEEFSEWSYDDFRDKKIMVHLWSENPTHENRIAAILLIFSSFGLAVLVMGIRSLGGRNVAILVIGFGFLMSFLGFYLFVSYLLVKHSNRQIIKEEKEIIVSPPIASE